MSTTTIGLKLGSNISWIFKPDAGMVLCEPTLIAISTSLKNKEVKAVGYEAQNLIGRTPENISLFSPISNGVVQYEELVSLLVKEFMNKIFPVKKFNQKLKAVLFISECLDYNEKKQFENCLYKAGINEVVFVPEVLCYDLGNSNKNNNAKLYVNIGQSQTNISIVSQNSIVNAFSLSIGNSIIDIAIKKYIEDKYFIKIGSSQASYIRNEMCSLYENYQISLNVFGLNTKTQSKEQIVLNSNEFYPILSYYYGKIAESINSIINSSGSVIISDISNNGIYFFGGGSDIAGLETFMLKSTGYFINNINDSEFEKIGAKQILNSPILLKNVSN